MEKLPLKEIVFTKGEDGTGVLAMSLVKNPAIQRQGVLFGEHKPIKITFADEEKGIFFAPVLIPNQKVYRKVNGEEFNLFASKETIEAIAVDFFANYRTKEVNLEHKETPDKHPLTIEGVTIFQSIITNENTVEKVKGHEDLPMGTLFFGAKVTNPEIKQSIKEGTFTGWSIHAVFDTEQVSLSSLEISDLEIILGHYFTKNS